MEENVKPKKIRLVNRSAVKTFLLENSNKKITSVGSDVSKILDDKVKNILNEAIKRADENKRRTILGRDI